MADTIRYGTTTDQEGKDRYFNTVADLPEAREFGPGLGIIGESAALKVSNGVSWSQVSVLQVPTLADLPPASEFVGVSQIESCLLYSDGISWKSQILTLGNSAVKATLTGSTEKTIMAQIPIPNDAMGPNSSLVIEPKWLFDNTANNKTMSITIGQNASEAALTTTAGYTLYNVTRGTGFNGAQPLLHFVNKGIKTEQLKKYSDLSTYSPGNSSNAEQLSTIDFSRQDLNVYILGTLALGTESLHLLSYQVSIINPYL